jgi:triphosphatase
MPEEIELKLRINAKDIPRLKRSPLVRQHVVGKPQTRKLTSIYYDTPSLALLRSKVSVRVRRMSGRWFQSIKTSGQATDGLHSRLEWEDLLQSGHPNFDKMQAIDHVGIRQLLTDSSMQASLQPIFSTVVKRTEWQIQWQQTHLELALDIGHVVIANTEVTEICELEIELKSGDADAIQAFAKHLQSEFKLTKENSSKAELGYSLYLQQQRI